MTVEEGTVFSLSSFLHLVRHSQLDWESRRVNRIWIPDRVGNDGRRGDGVFYVVIPVPFGNDGQRKKGLLAIDV